MAQTSRAGLEHVLRARSGDAAWKWLEDAIAAPSAELLSRAYTAAPKHLGRASLAVSIDEQHRLAASAPGLDFTKWTMDDAARAVLLLSAADHLDNAAFVDAATVCFERGDAREQQSWLRAVALLPQPQAFLALTIDACRTNILPLFESIACENPYPARYFPEHNFNQLVLKALFNNVALGRIVDLATRVNGELTRMAGDYAAERRAAGRSVPADIGLAIADRGAAEELPR
jgi:hypothetical protein